MPSSCCLRRLLADAFIQARRAVAASAGVHDQKPARFFHAPAGLQASNGAAVKRCTATGAHTILCLLFKGHGFIRL